MFRRFKKRHISIVLFYFLLILLGVSILIDPVIPVKLQDVLIGFLVILVVHFLNERRILFKRVKIFADDIKRVKSKEVQKEEFVANITHDLKTPTLAQIGTIKILLDNKVGYLNEEQESLLRQVLSSCTYMSEMINTILYTYKYDDGEIKLECENFDLRNTIHQICLNLSELANNNEQNIILDAKEAVETYADKLQISRVITNLISNAIKYGSNKQNILVNLENKGNNIIFEVKNDKGNLEKKELDKLFEKFETSSKTSTGLGLYISRKIIEKHQGSIFARDEGDKISFGFTLPLVYTKVCHV